jgi:hypothetical protein
MTIWPTHISCWIANATNKHSEYVIIIAFPLQKWLHQRASILRYISRLVYIKFSTTPKEDGIAQSV